MHARVIREHGCAPKCTAHDDKGKPLQEHLNSFASGAQEDYVQVLSYHSAKHLHVSLERTWTISKANSRLHVPNATLEKKFDV